MTRNDLINSVAERANLSKADASKALTAVIDSITEALERNEGVSLVGFGTFGVKSRNERIGRNPKDGTPMTIQASRLPVFKPGKMLKDVVN
ncbi:MULTISPECIES: HU family DNA-binding protein [Pseudomonas]|uniref:HU family DNA-binding protein n=2 Tax=Pseudomonas TaxID=286 RepID=A0A2X2CYI4_PSELU|nr:MULTISPECIES: HU family DNA-binding protein [Pseudomonas]MCG7375325.1 HU family DNA-binding protein [Pseudomonas luteola]SER23520.1 DNA-binding protein HU-beta [Pseudomonas lutea]SPZ05005.1 HU family DNA-binding protein [Pseudomonas luteola]